MATVDPIDNLVKGLEELDVRNKIKESGGPPPNDNRPPLKPKKGLTPYQGDLRTYGYFRCEKCQSDWSSANSWADTAQKCEICKEFRFPYRQNPFNTRPSPKAGSKPHVTGGCGKCIQIKDSCTKIKSCDERPESKNNAPIVGLDQALTNIKPKPPKRKRNRKPKKD